MGLLMSVVLEACVTGSECSVALGQMRLGCNCNATREFGGTMAGRVHYFFR